MAFGNGIPLEALVAAARGLSPEEFGRAYGDAFLLLDGGEVGVAPTTLDTVATLRLSTPAGQSIVPVSSTLAFRLVQKPTSTFDFIAVGRHEGNDVSLPHASVSRFHAYFRGHGTRLTLQDARSENGTFVDDVRVRDQSAGPPVDVTAGQTLRFGDVETTLVGADHLYRLITAR